MPTSSTQPQIYSVLSATRCHRPSNTGQTDAGGSTPCNKTCLGLLLRHPRLSVPTVKERWPPPRWPSALRFPQQHLYISAKAVATTTSDPSRPISHASARFLIRRTLTGPPPANWRTADVYGGIYWSSRSHPIAESLRQSPRPSADSMCPLCKEQP